jgi:rhamnogalacturonyl hydrolase YesR
LNRKTMVRQQQLADAVRNMLWHAWNNSRKNRFPDRNPRYRLEIDLKSMHAKPIG